MANISLTVKLLAEFMGTFFLMLAVLVSGGNALVIGGALALIVFLTGGISGAAVNPALTLGLLSIGSMDVTTSISYIVIQGVAAVGAAMIYKMVA